MNDFQTAVDAWMLETFGPEISADKTERVFRFLEEALELVQALGCLQSDVYKLIDYTYNRPEGEPAQKVGGVMVTLAALCSAHGIGLEKVAWDERHRCWEQRERIRTKQLNKPKGSPLPQAVESLVQKQANHLEAFAAAFCKSTALDPRDCVLVQQTDGKLIRWWFEPKERASSI